MHLLYLDDSGGANDASHRFFVLAGVCVFERQGHWMSEQLDQVAARFDEADPSSVELHASPMVTGSKFWRSQPVDKRRQAVIDALQVLSDSHASTRVFAAVIDKRYIGDRDAVEFAFEELVVRFDHYLMRLFRGGDRQRGLIIFDKSRQEAAIQNLALNFKRIGHSRGFLRNMAEVPVFLDSKASRLVQLADLVAYAVFRRFERDDPTFFDVIARRFDVAGGTQHGLFVLSQELAAMEPALC
ncbi:MAG: DUF3800 domain-containing protein [Rhodospirillaceae bacterium]|nr:DUF3800 domain-containing protein [Rhodospirillales bacterium]